VGKRAEFVVGASSTLLLGSILEGTVSFDGQEVSRVNWSQTGGCTLLCFLPATVTNISPGSHTITFTVVHQTQNVIDYLINFTGTLIDPNNGQRQDIDMPLQRVRLRVGGTVTFTLRV